MDGGLGKMNRDLKWVILQGVEKAFPAAFTVKAGKPIDMRQSGTKPSLFANR
jgi:hypothetical protein